MKKAVSTGVLVLALFVWVPGVTQATWRSEASFPGITLTHESEPIDSNEQDPADTWTPDSSETPPSTTELGTRSSTDLDELATQDPTEDGTSMGGAEAQVSESDESQASEMPKSAEETLLGSTVAEAPREAPDESVPAEDEDQ